MRFFRGTFFKSLAKLSAYVFVGWNTLLVCIVFSIFSLGVILSGFSGAPETFVFSENTIGELEHVYGDDSSLNQILIIPVEGIILGEDEGGSFGRLAGLTSGYGIKQKLYEAAQRSEVKGVLLTIDSPGGTIFGSRAIADGVEYYQQKSGNPVVAFVQGLSASGGYMASLTSDKIIADYGTAIGSIGVIMGPFKYYDKVISESGSLFDSGVLTQNGIESVTISAGESKDLGNPYRKLTSKEKDHLQKSINNEYDQFIRMVSENRNITAKNIRQNIGAMIYDPGTAKQLGLIDQISSREKSYAEVAKFSGINEYQVVREAENSGFLSFLFSTKSEEQGSKTEFDACSLTKHKLAYYGNITEFCQ